MNKDSKSGTSYVLKEGEGERFDVLGAHMVWKARGDATDETFTVAVQTLGPQEHIPLHRHAYPEVFFVTSGEVVFTLTQDSKESEVTVRAGGTVIVAANSYHSARNVTGSDATLLDIACFKHQQFFDAVQLAHPAWDGLTPQAMMQHVGEIAMQHTLEFRAPD